MVFGAGIALTFAAYRLFKLDAVASFWIAYILTRPFGASFGDLLSQPRTNGGLGLGTVGTSALFLAVIFELIVIMTKAQRRSAENGAGSAASNRIESNRIEFDRAAPGSCKRSTLVQR